MTDLQPNPEDTTPRPVRSIPVKRVITWAAVGALLVVALFGFSSWQASSNFSAELDRIDNLIQNEDFAAAENAITAAQFDDADNPDLRALEEKTSKLKLSKTSFEQGSQYLFKKDYQAALDELKKVDKVDVTRFSQAQSKIHQAKNAYTAQALEEALSLKGKKKYNDAIAVINRAGIYVTVGAELKALKDELEPLALAEIKRAEERQLAVYRNALKKMRVETDKFNGTKFYTDRSTPYYANYSTFHIYIGKTEGGDPYLRLKVRYSDDDWLFVESASINIDGDVRDLDVGSDWDRDNGSGDIWEWVDVNATESHLSLVKDVINSKSAVIRYFGSKYRDDRTITSAQKRALQNVLDAYEALKRL
jgi:hypothetical protein